MTCRATSIVAKVWTGLRSKSRATVGARAAIALLALALLAGPSSAADPKRIYLALDDHTDYMWKGDEAQYRQAFLEMLDYYLDLADQTASDPPAYQSRFNTDGSFWIWTYERNRTSAELDRLFDRIRSGHISVPLNALVSTYGAQPAEAVLRGMYYAGRLERRFGVRFPLVQAMENQTLPLGLGALWAGAGARYTWKGVCGCATDVPQLSDRDHEIYRWLGLDGSSLLIKWNSLFANDRSIGGYAEARDPVAAVDFLDSDPTFLASWPYRVSAAFGHGWDDLSTLTSQFPSVAQGQTNAARQVIVSNEADFFEDFEATHGAGLPGVSSSFGNEWDTYSASMAEVTGRVRRAVEKLRGAESLATLVSLRDPAFLAGREAARDLAWMDLGLYWEHDWTADGAVPRSERAAWQRRLAAEIESYVDDLHADAASVLGGQIQAPGGNLRFYAFNPLSWVRTDMADLPYADPAPVHAVEVESGQETPSQIVTVDGQRRLRVLARDVPAAGYKVYEVRPGAGASYPDAATVAGAVIENAAYRITLAGQGAITSLVDKQRQDRELVRAISGRSVNDLGAGSGSLSVENRGPVSVTLKAVAGTPLDHETRVTLLADGERIEIRNDITQNFSSVQTWAFGFELDTPYVRHEEVGAILRARLASQGGHYAARNARYEWLTLNHFADMSEGSAGPGVTLSSADLSFMRLGASSVGVLDTSSPQISVLAGGQVDGSNLGIQDQGGDSRFLQRFALRSHGGYDAVSAMRFALEHQNPLVTGVVSGGSAYPADRYSFLSISDPDVLLWSLKPAEEGVDQGLVVRLWNLGASASTFSVSLDHPISSAERTTHIETPLSAATVLSDGFRGSAAAGQLVTYRLGAQVPALSISDVTLGEAGNASFEVSLSAASAQPVTVAYATLDGSATAPGDYAARSGTLRFAPGVTARTLSVPVVSDALVEPTETFSLRLSAPTNATLAADEAVATILDDDTAGTLALSLAAYKVSEAGPKATVTVSRTGGAASGVTVGYEASDGSALTGSDYTAVAGTLSFGANAKSASFTVPVTNDGLIEGDESVVLRIFSPGGGATLGTPSTALLTITDNDLGGAIRFSAASYSVNESLASATITLTRTGGTGGPVTVDYQTSGGTATPGSDYTAASGTLTFAAGQTSRTFTVPILLDEDDEDNESVGLQLSAPSPGATLGSPSSGTLTLVDNDSAGSVQFSLTGYTVDEASASALVTATRSGGSAGPVTVDYQTANGSATAGSDYTAGSGTLTFGSGVLSQSFGVPIANDGSVEGPESVDLTLSNPTGRLTLGTRKTALLTITDDEPGVTLHFSAAGYTVSEGSLATLTVERSGPTTSALTVDYQTSDGSALAGSDYTAALGTLSFKAGISTLTFKLTTTGDSADENDEDLNLALSNPTGGATLGTQATATLKILDNDAGGALKFSAASYSRSEGLPTATITVSRTGGLASSVTVNYASSDGTAQAGVDYTTTSGTLSFASGQTSRTFTVPILADALDEDNESLTLTLSNPTGGASLGSPTAATLTLTDDDTDGVFEFSVSGYTGSEGGAPATVTVTRSGGKAGPVTVDYQTSNGTALSGSDYTAASGTLTFAAGILSQTFAVPLADDAATEGSETVNLTLNNPSGKATLGARSTALLTITDNDGVTLHFAAPTYSVTEGGSGVVIVKRSGSTASAVSVQYASSDGSATTADGDYTAKSGTLSFKAGQTSLSFTLATTADTRDESNEDLNLTLSNPTGGASLGTQSTATLTILDNDAGGALKFGAATYSKTEAGPTATLTVTRTGGVASGVTVDYASTDGTAQAGSDYTAAAGTLSFAAGQASRTFTVTLANDTLDELNETLTLDLSAATGGASIGGPATTTLTILDNDVAGTLQFSSGSYSVGESDGTLTVAVTRSGGAASGVTVNYATSNGTATAGSDYTAASGTLTFAANETTRAFAVTITPDGSVEANETVTLTLSAPGGGATLGSPSSATLYIVDDE